jgi:hypothetical protein
MRVNRRLLYWGVLFVAIGGVLVAADLGLVPTTALTDALRLWPLAIIAIGLAIVVRRTEFSLPALLLAAAVPGLVVGAAFAAAPRLVGACGVGPQTVSADSHQGSFDGPAFVAVKTGCGVLDVRTAPGSGWQFTGSSTAGKVATVDATSRLLSIDATRDDVNVFDDNREAWALVLPTSEMRELTMAVTAGQGQVDLPGADIGRLELKANAAKVALDASEATVDELSGVVNVGSLSIRLPQSDLTGTLRVGGGSARICTPPNVGLRVSSDGFADGISVAGTHLDEGNWESPNYASATHHADLRVHLNFGAIEIDPKEGCA